MADASGGVHVGFRNRVFDETYVTSTIAKKSRYELRKLAGEHTPCILASAVGSLDKVSRNKNRVAQYTYVVAEEGETRWSLKTIAPQKARDLIARQAEYIQRRGALIAIDGYLGLELKVDDALEICHGGLDALAQAA